MDPLDYTPPILIEEGNNDSTQPQKSITQKLSTFCVDALNYDFNQAFYNYYPYNQNPFFYNYDPYYQRYTLKDFIFELVVGTVFRVLLDRFWPREWSFGEWLRSMAGVETECDEFRRWREYTKETKVMVDKLVKEARKEGRNEIEISEMAGELFEERRKMRDILGKIVEMRLREEEADQWDDSEDEDEGEEVVDDR